MTNEDVIMQRALTDQYTAVVERPVAGKNQSDSEKRMLQCHLLHQKSHIKYLGLNLRLCGMMPVPDCLSYNITYMKIHVTVQM
jgi:hypothetical protein